MNINRNTSMIYDKVRLMIMSNMLVKPAMMVREDRIVKMMIVMRGSKSKSSLRLMNRSSKLVKPVIMRREDRVVKMRIMMPPQLSIIMLKIIPRYPYLTQELNKLHLYQP